MCVKCVLDVCSLAHISRTLVVLLQTPIHIVKCHRNASPKSPESKHNTFSKNNPNCKLQSGGRKWILRSSRDILKLDGGEGTEDAELWRDRVGGVEYVRAINKTKNPQIKNSTWWRGDIHLSIIALLAVRVSRHSQTLRVKNSTRHFLPIKITNLQSEQLRVFVDLSDMLNPAMVSVCL